MTDDTYQFDPVWVAAYYDEYGEKEWERMTKTPWDEVSLHIHTELLKEYLRPGMRVLEVGAAAGRFTRILARLGCRITAVDLSKVQLDLNKGKATEHGFAAAVEEWRQLDMCDMACFEAGAFDAVVCYGGPLSYVFEKADQAVRECRRVLKTDGLFLCSVMSLFGAYHTFLEGVSKIPPEINREIVATGNLTPRTQPDTPHWCHLFRSPELRELLEHNGLSVLDMSSANFLSVCPGFDLAEIRDDPVKWNELLHHEREACRQPGCLDTGTHMIAVCRKQG